MQKYKDSLKACFENVNISVKVMFSCIKFDSEIFEKRSDFLVNTLVHNKYFKKKIYDEVTEDIFDMSNVRFLNKEIEKKKWGCLYFVMSSVS